MNVYEEVMPVPRTVGLIALTEKPGVDHALNEMANALAAFGIESITIKESERLPELVDKVDMLITFGGDGTILSLASLAALHRLPLAGVNLGRLGFLTTCSVREIPEFVCCLSRGDFLVDDRTLLEARLFDEGGAPKGNARLALNEVSLARGQNGKMVDLDAVVDGVLLNRYHADGVLVATATGSSAYSLSAGGPLVWPGSGVICVTPVCPHSLTNRSVILPNYCEICLRPRERRGRADSMLYSLDGRDAHEIEVGEFLTIKKSDLVLSLVHLPNYNFADLLRTKLRWQSAELPGNEV